MCLLKLKICLPRHDVLSNKHSQFKHNDDNDIHMNHERLQGEEKLSITCEVEFIASQKEVEGIPIVASTKFASHLHSQEV